MALFDRFYNEGWNYTFGPSEVVMIDLETGKAVGAEANVNANGLTVNGDYAYVTSYGGAQQPGGNEASQMEVFVLTNGSPEWVTSIDASAIPNNFGGDFSDVAFANGKAYVLVAHYNDDYSQYEYMIIQTTENDLLNGVFGTAVKFYDSTVAPAAPTIVLLPNGNDLYFIDGVSVYSIDTSVDISASALTRLCTAANFTLTEGETTYTGYEFNTAGIVIEDVNAGTGRKIHSTKVAKRSMDTNARFIAKVAAKEEEEK